MWALELDEVEDVNVLPPIDRQGLADRLRNFIYPAVVFSAIATVWMIGWASSIEARANVGYWSAAAHTPFNNNAVDANQTSDPEQRSQVATISDQND